MLTFTLAPFTLAPGRLLRFADALTGGPFTTARASDLPRTANVTRHATSMRFYSFCARAVRHPQSSPLRGSIGTGASRREESPPSQSRRQRLSGQAQAPNPLPTRSLGTVSPAHELEAGPRPDSQLGTAPLQSFQPAFRKKSVCSMPSFHSFIPTAANWRDSQKQLVRSPGRERGFVCSDFTLGGAMWLNTSPLSLRKPIPPPPQTNFSLALRRQAAFLRRATPCRPGGVR